ncbi:MAG TPA: MFS transporter [Candidatus Dormibacteraeota bacterium]
MAAAFGSMFTVFAVVYSFGAFFDSMAREFHAGRAATSAVFSITVFLYFTLGSVTGALADRVGPRRVLVVGALVMAAGLGLTSVSPSIWLGYLSYGLGVGIGVACGYVPMVAAVGGWFTRGRSLALGLAISGIGFGTLVGAPVAAALIKSFGWRETLVLQAAATLVLLAVCAALAERPPVAAATDLRLGAAVRTRRFAALYLNGTMAGFALFMAFAHLTPFAIRRGTEPVAAAALVGVIGAGSAVGRLALTGIAEPLGAVRAFQTAALLFAASFAVWLLAPSYAGLVVFAAALGVGYGGWVALAPSVVAELFGTERLGGTIGALYTGPGLGALVGAPLAGFMVDRTGSYTPAIATALVLAAVGFLPVLGLRVSSSHGDRQPG